MADALEAHRRCAGPSTDPGTPEDGRARLVHGLFDGKVSEPRPNRGRGGGPALGGRPDLGASDRAAGRPGPADARRRAGDLDETEDELFRFARLVESDPELRNVLGRSRGRPAAAASS